MIVGVMVITGLSYRQASSVIVGLVLSALFVAVLYLLIRSRRESIQAARTMRNIKELQAVQQALIPKFRTYAENIEDKRLQADVLESLEVLSRSTGSPTASLQEKVRHTQAPVSRARTGEIGDSD